MAITQRDRGLILFGVTAFIGGVLLTWMLWELRAVLIILYISCLLAIGLSPAVVWIEGHRFGARGRRLPRWGAVLALYVWFFLASALVVSLIVPPLVEQLGALGQHMPEYLEQAQRFLVTHKVISRTWTWTDLVQYVPSAGDIVSGVLGAMQNVIGAIGTVATIAVLPYYLLVDASTLQRGLLRLVAPERRDRMARLTQAVALKVGAWLSGQILLCFIMGTATSVLLWAVGVPYFYVFGLIAGIGEAVPVIGPIMSAVPAVLMASTVSMNKAAIVAVLFWGLQSIENNFLVPRVMERQVGLSTVTVLVALLCGSTLLGIVGALLAVPTAAILQVLVQEFLRNAGETPWDASAAASASSDSRTRS